MNYKLLLPIAVLFAATLLISNTLEVKMFTVAGITLPAGTILFPLAYLFGDALTEVYGYAVARKVIWSGFLALLLMVVFYALGTHLPPAAIWEHQAAFQTVFAQVPRIALASMIAYLCGEFVNSYIVARMKVAMAGKWMALRFFLSTLIGQSVDTAVFMTIAFAGVYAFPDLWPAAVATWLAKVAWETIALPLTVPAVRCIKKIENVDHYDRDTNFNPVVLR